LHARAKWMSVAAWWSGATTSTTVTALLVLVLVPVLLLALMASPSSLVRAHLAKFKIKWSQEIKHAGVVKGTRYPYYLVEIQGPWAMEDRAHVEARLGGRNLSLYGVFDGHNGSQASRFCQRHIAHLLAHSPVDVLAHPAAALERAFKQADGDFLATKHEDAGTTALVMLAHDNMLHVASCGDSRAILVRKDASVLPLSVEHKPDRLDERQRIARAGGTIEHWGVWRVEGLLAMSRAIGDEKLKQFVIPDPDVVSHAVTKDDAFVVLATDGLFDVLRNDEVAGLCRGELTSEAAATRLATEVVTRGIVDNTTIIVVQL